VLRGPRLQRGPDTSARHESTKKVKPFSPSTATQHGVRCRPPAPVPLPQGPSFVLDGSELRWQRWKLRVGFKSREGIVLHT
jgi:Cu2+-containing amine oxidase